MLILLKEKDTSWTNAKKVMKPSPGGFTRFLRRINEFNKETVTVAELNKLEPLLADP